MKKLGVFVNVVIHLAKFLLTFTEIYNRVRKEEKPNLGEA